MFYNQIEKQKMGLMVTKSLTKKHCKIRVQRNFAEKYTAGSECILEIKKLTQNQMRQYSFGKVVIKLDTLGANL